jgi:type IV pilus assembly protein PilB
MQALTEIELKQLIETYQLATPERLVEASQLAGQQKISFQDALIKTNVLSEINLAQLMADYWKLPYINLSSQSIDDKTLRTIPEVMSRTQKVVAFREDKNGLHVAMVDPTNLEVRRALEKRFDKPVKIHVAARQQVLDSLRGYHEELKDELDSIISQHVAAFKGQKSEDAVELPIIRITDAMLEYGARNNASDIHIEPTEKNIKIRFRIDGLLQDVLELPKHIHNAIVTRIKILSKLRIDEHFSAQDGRFDYDFNNQKTDVRVSILPVTEGEKVVMRLLSERAHRLTLEELGLASADLEKVKVALSRPHGMILSAGPTGSGKTTSLYSIIQLINDRSVNISTIEDPVEYNIEGINQIQVNPKTNLTFAKGLRSILRQDPDIIMVGEIRDEETADIAVNAAMTGHLVLSTIHANNASTVLPRLIEMKIQPFLVASSINIIISQRLIRRICRRCIYSVELSKKEIDAISKFIPLRELLKKPSMKTFRTYRGRGCTICGHSGYAGRVGLFEVMLMDDEIRRAVIEEKSSSVLEAIAQKQGMTTMLEDGIEKVKQGVTSIEEILRVIADA